MVLGDLIADLVAPLLTVALQLLSVLDAAGTIVGQILGTRAPAAPANAGRTSADAGSRTGGNAGTAAAAAPHGSGRKLCRCGPATALQEVGCGAAGTRPAPPPAPTAPVEARGTSRKLFNLAGRRPGAGCDTCARSARAAAGARPRPPPGRAAAPAPAAGRAAAPAPAAGRAAAPRRLRPCLRRPWQANGRPRPTCRRPRRRLRRRRRRHAATSTTASEDVVLHEKKDRSDEYQESRYTFHVVT